MKRITIKPLLALLFAIGLTFNLTAQDLMITGVFDGPTSGNPKVIELYVINDIADLSAYGFGSATNGGGTDGEEYTFPADSYAAGDFIYIGSETDVFTSYFGFAPTYVSTDAAINGDDAVELFHSSTLIDVYGVQDVLGDGEPWDYTDGWAYRNNGTSANTTFTLAEWNFSGIDVNDGQTSNATAPTPFPIGTFTMGGPASEVDWCNLQWPDVTTVDTDVAFDVYARVYEAGVTDAVGQGANIECWIGYSTTDTDPSTWTDWVVATYNTDQDVNNDEYMASLSFSTAGTYYYASRFSLESGPYTYGGYNVGGGNIWDGTTNVSGVATVNAGETFINLPISEDFEAGLGNITLVNGTEANYWMTGALASQTGNALYVTNDGTLNEYNNGTTSTSHAYIPIDFNGITNATLSFDWICDGEGVYTDWDYLRVYLMPSTETLEAGTLPSTTYQIGENYVEQATLQNVSITLTSAEISQNQMRLVFTWRNDGSSGDNPPASVDNITLDEITCPAPTTLAANNVTATSADLSWNEEGSATGWNIEIATASITPGTTAPELIFSGAATANPHTISTLAENTTYYFYVQSDCTSEWSTEGTFTTPLACPAPTTLTATNITATSADLGWTEEGDATGWNIEIATASITPGTSAAELIFAGAATGNPHALSGLSASTTYFFYVQSDCTSEWSVEGTFTTSDNYINLPISEDFESGLGNILLVNGTETNYWMQGALASQTGNALYVTDNNVDNQYTTGSYSIAHAYIPIDFAGITNATLSFDWICNGETVSYDYMRVYLVPDTESIDAGALISIGQIGQTNYNNQLTLENESIILTSSEITQDQMKLVFTWKNDGSDGANPPASIDNITIDAISCPAPTTLAANNITATSADLGWTEEGTAIGWNIEVATASITPGTSAAELIFAGAATGNPHTISTLSENTTYYFYVQSDCTSEWSTEGTFTTPLACPAPTTLTATNITATSADLGWTEEGDATGWNIEIATASITPGTSAAELIFAGAATGNPHALSGLSASTTYFFYVQSDCTSEWSVEGTFTTDCDAISSFTWTEGFEGTFAPTCWTNTDWSQSNYGDPHTGSEFAYSNTTGSELTTPALEIPATGSYMLSYWYRAESASYAQDADVLLSTDGVTFDVTIENIAGYSSTDYTETQFDLSAYAGQTVWVKFVGQYGTGGYSYGICLDDVTVRELASGNDILTFTHPNETAAGAIIDPVAHSVVLEVASGTDITTLNPTITVSDYATVSPLSGDVVDFTDSDITPVVYTVTAENGDIQPWNVTVNVSTTLSSDNDIETFVLTEQTGDATIDNVAHTVTIEVNWLADLTNLTPTITTSALSTITPNSGEAQDFSTSETTPFEYTVEAEDGTPQIWEVTVSQEVAPLGANCSNPYIVNIPADLTYEDLNQTNCGLGHSYENTAISNGSYDSGEDAVYEITVTADTYVRITLDPKATGYSSLSLFDACPDTGALIAEGDFDWTSNPRVIELALTSGTTYYAMIDTYTAPDCIPDYDFTIEAICPDPTNIMETNLTATSADIEWTAGGFETGWNIKVNEGVAIADPTTTDGDIVLNEAVVSTTYTIPATLTAETDYYVYVQADCGSDWVEYMFTTPSDCPVPTGLDALVTGQNSATLSWNELGVSDWNIKISLTPLADPGSVTADIEDVITGSTGEYLATGLTAGTIYYWYVESDCGSGWSTEGMFTTECGVYTSLPFIEDFESGIFPPTCWTSSNEDATGTEWVSSTDQNHTTSGTTSAHHLYSSAAMQDGWLITPQIELPAGGSYELSFWQYSTWPGDYDTYSVLVSTTGTATTDFTEVWSPATVEQNWVNEIINLSSYESQTIYVAFRYEGNNSSGWWIDDVIISETVVANPQIDGIDTNSDVADINVCLGDDEATAIAGLVTEITITDTDAGEHTVALTWTIDSYDGNTADAYTATGTFVLPAGVDQTDPATTLEVSAVVTVNELPVVTCPSTMAMTSDAGVTTLTGATPAGGEYTGTNVTAGDFDPTGLAIGLYTITYTYTDPTTGCVNSCDFDIDIVTSIETLSIEGINVYPNPNNGEFTIDFQNVEGDVTYQIYDTKGSIIVLEDISANGNTVKEVSLDLVPGVYYVKVVTSAKTIIEKLVVQ